MWTWFEVTGAAVVLTAAAGFLYESAGAARDRTRYTPAGRLIDIGGRKLHILTKGSRGPTVVIEQGLGGPSTLGWNVQDRIAKFARVVSYDRAGIAWSDPAPATRTIHERAEDLYALLQHAEIPGPFVLVGHSYGGLIVRAFAHAHPEQVAGIVLLDSAEEQLIFSAPSLKSMRQFRTLAGVLKQAARFGLLRLWGTLFPDKPAPENAATHALSEVICRAPNYFEAIREECSSYFLTPEQKRVAHGFGSLGDIPLAVISHGKPDAFPGFLSFLEDGWPAAQARLLSLSTNRIHITAKNSGHMIAADEPEVVVDAVQRVHEAALTGRRLGDANDPVARVDGAITAAAQ